MKKSLVIIISIIIILVLGFVGILLYKNFGKNKSIKGTIEITNVSSSSNGYVYEAKLVKFDSDYSKEVLPFFDLANTKTAINVNNIGITKFESKVKHNVGDQVSGKLKRNKSMKNGNTEYMYYCDFNE